MKTIYSQRAHRPPARLTSALRIYGLPACPWRWGVIDPSRWVTCVSNAELRERCIIPHIVLLAFKPKALRAAWWSRRDKLTQPRSRNWASLHEHLVRKLNKTSTKHLQVFVLWFWAFYVTLANLCYFFFFTEDDIRVSHGPVCSPPPSHDVSFTVFNIVWRENKEKRKK